MTPTGEPVLQRAMRLGRARPTRVAGRVVGAALVTLLALRLVQLWHRHPVDFSRVDGAVLVLAVAASAAAVTAYGLVWPYLLRRLGVQASAGWITLFFKSQLGKYLPGSVWQYAGRAGLASHRGVPVRTTLASMIVEVAASALAAAMTGLLVLPPGWALASWLVLAVFLAVGVAFVRRLPTIAAGSDRELLSGGLRAMPPAGALYVVVWGAYGVAFWLTGRALFAVPLRQLPLYVGAFALAWLAGLVVVFAPGGIGVREAVIAGLLSSRLGEGHAIVLAGTSRIILTAVDLVAGAVSLSLPLVRLTRARAEP